MQIRGGEEVWIVIVIVIMHLRGEEMMRMMRDEDIVLKMKDRHGVVEIVIARSHRIGIEEDIITGMEEVVIMIMDSIGRIVDRNGVEEVVVIVVVVVVVLNGIEEILIDMFYRNHQIGFMIKNVVEVEEGDIEEEVVEEVIIVLLL